MKKLLYVILCGVTLTAIEFFLLLIFYLIEGFALYTVPKAIIQGAIRDTNEIIAARFVFYFLFWVLAIYFLYDKVNIKYPTLKLALVNCALYIVISIVMVLFFPFASEFFKESFFYFLVIATLLSPLILSNIPYIKRIINTI